MKTHDNIYLLVRDIQTSRAFYTRCLGFKAGDGTVLTNAYGQTLELIKADDGPVGGGGVIPVTVESLPEAINLMLVSGSERARWMVHGEPLYYGPDRELLLLEERSLALLSKVRLVVYDFDGVMTDNRVFVDEHGTESVAANRSDGLGIGMIRKLGLVQCILSTEVNPVVQARAAKLGIPAVNGVRDKGSALKELAAEHGVSLDEILFVGNDVNDSEPMKLAGVSVSPADGHPDIRNMADLVTKATGGHGVIRELTDMLISAGSGSEPGQA